MLNAMRMARAGTVRDVMLLKNRPQDPQASGHVWALGPQAQANSSYQSTPAPAKPNGFAESRAHTHTQ